MVSRATRPVAGPEGELYYASNQSGHAQVYRIRSPGAAPECLTMTVDRVVSEFWTRHGLVLQGDRGGNENWQLSLLRDNGELLALTRDERAIHSPVRLRPDGDALGLSWNPGGQQDMLLGELLLPGGELRPWLRPKGFWNWLAWSPRGDRAVVAQLFGSWSEAYFLQPSGHLARILPHARLVEAAEWTQSGLFVVTDAGEDFLGVAELDPDQPEEITCWLVKEAHDVIAFVAAATGHRAAAVINTGIDDEIRIIGLPSGKVIDHATFGTGIVMQDHTASSGRHITWSPDRRRLFVSWDTPTRPAEIVDYPDNQRWTHVNANEPAGLIEPLETSYRSFDDLTIPAIAYRIDGKPRPTVCLFHGGPEGQSRAGYAPLHHLLNAIGINTAFISSRSTTRHCAGIRSRMAAKPPAGYAALGKRRRSRR